MSSLVIEWNGLDAQAADQPGASRGPEAEFRSVGVRTIRRGHWKLNVHVTGEFELYDFRVDPGELHNAILDPGTEPVVGDLFARLRSWQVATNDLLNLPDPVTA